MWLQLEFNWMHVSCAVLLRHESCDNYIITKMDWNKEEKKELLNWIKKDEGYQGREQL